MDLVARLEGAIWGHLVGDAVGVPYEFRPSDRIGDVEFGATGTHGQPAGTWSDDGALMLAQLDSLVTVGFDPADFGRRAADWYRRGAYTPDGDGLFDIGGATRAAIERLEAGVPAESAGGTDDRSCGNGSLMRILPLALVERDILDTELVEHAQRLSAVTHGHPRVKVACALYVLLARSLLNGNARAEALGWARDRLRAIYEQGSADADDAALIPALDHLESWPERGGRGRVWDSFWSAWDAVAGADSYRATIERAIAYGNDTDTTAAIAGGLAGLRFGIGGIPPRWLAGMRGGAIVAPLVERVIVGPAAGVPPRVERLRELANLVPILEAPDADFGHWVLPPPKDGMHSFGWFELGPVGEAFQAAVGRGGWVIAGFDWRTWLESGDGRTLHERPELVDEATPDQLAKLLTAIVRSDRFVEGSIEGAFASGLLARIARRAAVLLEAG